MLPKSIIVAKEKPQQKRLFSYHVGILNNTTRQLYTMTKRLGQTFSEFDGTQITNPFFI